MTVEAMKGEHISYELKETEAQGRPAYELTVDNELAEPGRYNDRLVLITDAASQPLTITVIGYIEKGPDTEE